jgi:hypothetical protein
MKRLLLMIMMISCLSVYAQEEKKTEEVQEVQEPYDWPKLSVYLDCVMCDMMYLMQEMEYVNFSRNPEDADVYVMVRTQMTGSGGTEYLLEITGQKEYTHITSNVSFSVQSTTTEAERREEMRKTISMGLGSYLSQLTYKVIEQREKEKAGEVVEKKVESPAEQKDPWNNWVFNLGVNGRMNGEESSKSRNYGFNFSSKQVTKKHKFYLQARYDNNKSEFSFGPTKIISEKTTKSLKISEAISISDHWSVGAFLDMGGSDYQNKDFYLSLKPAIEYSLFTYDEASKKQITLAYRVGQLYNDYKERTVFNKTTETRWQQSIVLGASIKQKWGNIHGNVDYNLMLDETSLYSFDFGVGMNVRLFKGFSMNLSGNYSITRDQINIAGGGVSQDELLLRQKQIQSGYNFFTTLGFSYSFGSMFNTVVNPRFGF